jgi:hypothetical protein
MVATVRHRLKQLLDGQSCRVVDQGVMMDADQLSPGTDIRELTAILRRTNALLDEIAMYHRAERGTMSAPRRHTVKPAPLEVPVRATWPCDLAVTFTRQPPGDERIHTSALAGTKGQS